VEKPRLRFWQIWNMSFGFLGIQFGWSLQMNNMSAIYEYLGAKPDQLPFLWLAAPMTGLLVQPIIGHWSDNTWGPLGRRRPFFLAGAILSSFALIFMPLSASLWMAAGLLWILDASINISMEPFRAFVADILPDDQRPRGFAMQSFFIGIGSAGASILLPWLLQSHPWLLQRVMSHTGANSTHAIPPIVSISFWIGAIAFFSAVIWTIITTREYPPDASEAARLKTAKHFDLAEIVSSVREMPTTMRQLAAVQFLTWLGLFCMFLYFSVAVAHNVFGANPGEPAYTEGIIWAGYCSGFYNVVCFLFAPLLPALAKKLGKRGAHSLCLLAGAVGLISITVIHNKFLLFLPMAGVGIAWASILSMPYSILSAALPRNKTGVYMGIFNFFIVLPEIISALLFGWVMANLLGNDRMKALVVGGVCFILAAILTQRVREVAIEESALITEPFQETQTA
jgi:maltose/moltooligosaccharide transporter